MHWPRIRGLATSAGVWLRAKETEISAARWALRLGKGLYFTFLYLLTYTAVSEFRAELTWTLSTTARP